MNFSVENKPSYPTAAVRTHTKMAKVSAEAPATGPAETYTSGPSGLQTDVLALRRYAAQSGANSKSGVSANWTHTVAQNGQSTYSNMGTTFVPGLHPKVTYRTAPQALARQNEAAKSQSCEAKTQVRRPSQPAVSAQSQQSETLLQSPRPAAARPMAAPQPTAAPRSKEAQLNLVDAVYEKTAGARMDKSYSEQVCVWYAKDIYNELMDQKEAGKLPDYQPRIYGWERPADAQFGEAAARLGKTEAKNYAHNLAVLEDKDGNIVKVLDPWQTGALWTDSTKTFDSKAEYENARGDKWWRVGDLKGNLVPWPEGDEQHARLNRN